MKNKCKGFTYDKYIDTINNQCCTLRNPKKKVQSASTNQNETVSKEIEKGDSEEDKN